MEEYPLVSLSVLYITTKIKYLIKQFNKDSKLSNNELHLLIELFRNGGECSNDYLLHSIYCSKSLLSKYIVQLSEKGYLESFKPDDNRRTRIIRLTDKSSESCSIAYSHLLKFNDYIFNGFSVIEYEKFTEYSSRFFENMRFYPSYNYESKIEWPVAFHILVRIGYLLLKLITGYSKGYEHTTLRDFILLKLYGEKSDVSFKEIEKSVWNEQSMVSREISRLSKDGLVKISTVCGDRRVKRAKITDAGIQTAENGLKYAYQDEKKGLQGFSIEEIREFKTFLVKISSKINTYSRN